MSVTLNPDGSMAEAIQSIRDAGGWKAVMEALGQDHDRLFRELVGAVAEVPGEEPTMFEFWLVGFLAGLYNAATVEPIPGERIGSHGAGRLYADVTDIHERGQN